MDTIEYEALKRETIALLAASFDGVERGQGATLHEAMVMQAEGSEENRLRARALDDETRWQDVPDEDIRAWSSIFAFDEMGFRYYLPAYLVWYLQNYDNEDYGARRDTMTYVAIDILFFVNQSRKGRVYVTPYLTSLTREQSRAVAHFVQYLALYEMNLPAKYAAELAEAEARGESDPDEMSFLRARVNSEGEANSAHSSHKEALELYWKQFL